MTTTSRHICLTVTRLFISLFLWSSVALPATATVFKLHSFGITNSNVVIECDETVLIPSLASEKVSHESISEILPYRGSGEAKALSLELASHSELSLGHSTLYFYLAINLAFDRIFRNLLLDQTRMADRSQSERDYDAQLEARTGSVPYSELEHSLLNLRDLAKVKGIDGKTLRIRVFFGEDRFNTAAAQVGLHAARAFWDPDRMQIGLLFDKEIFRWYKQNVDWKTANSGTAAANARNYVVRQVLGSITHELVHFIQYCNGDFLRESPFLAEAAALLIQSNISLREEISQLASGQEKLGLDPLLAGSPCLALVKMSPPMYSSSLAQLYRGIEVARKGIRIDKILLMGGEPFYSQPKPLLKDQYDAALAFALFASELPRPQFERELLPILKGRKNVSARNPLKDLNVGFQKWADEQSREWWRSASVDEDYEITKRMTIACSERREYVAAYVGSQLMFVQRPGSPASYLLAGDVFFRMNIPFFALDFYSLSSSRWSKQFGPRDESLLHIESRLGDAFEEIGDIEKALEKFSNVAKFKPASVPDEYFITWLRCQLKKQYYEASMKGAYAHDERSLLLMNSYVEQLQGSDCSSAEDKQRVINAIAALKEDNVAKYRERLIAHYEAVSEQMRLEGASGKIADMVRAREEFCEGAK